MESAVRKRGAYFTPQPLASLLVDWAIRTPRDTILDPSCGEGIFLTESVSRLLALETPARALGKQITGIEIDPKSLAKTNGALLSRHPSLRWNRLIEGDFFSVTRKWEKNTTFDVIVGNPPYIRNQRRTPAEKKIARQRAEKAGIPLSGEASLWAPFLAATLPLLRPGGRLAMVIPREAVFVQYAKPLLKHLENLFSSTALYLLNDFHFSATEKVALLLCEGKGEGSSTLHIEEKRSLASLPEKIPTEPSPKPWTWQRIPRELRTSVEETLHASRMVPITDLAKVLLGVVTGEKSFFLRKKEESIPKEYLSPVISKPNQLEGSLLRSEDLRENPALLCIPKTYQHNCAPINKLVSEGTTQGVHNRYKCRTRKPWFAIQRIGDPPDGFLGYLIKRHLRCSANMARAQSTNNVHRVYLSKEWKKDRGSVFTSWRNPITMLSAELAGSFYGGGVLKLELGAMKNIVVPDPRHIKPLPIEKIDKALRKGDHSEIPIMEKEMARILQLPEKIVQNTTRAAEYLRDIRLGIRPASEGVE